MIDLDGQGNSEADTLQTVNDISMKIHDSGAKAIAIGLVMAAIGGGRMAMGKPGHAATVLLGAGAFVLLFGLGCLVMFCRRRMADRKRDAFLSTNPDAPWRVRDDWVANRILHNNLKVDKALLIIAIAWNLLSAPLVIVVAQEIKKTGSFHLLWLSFIPLIGLCMLYPIVTALLRAVRYGKSSLEMARTPAVVGKVMRAVVATDVDHAAGADAEFRVRLACVSIARRVRRSRLGFAQGGRGSLVTQNLWVDERVFKAVPRKDDPRRLAVPVAFPVPPDCLSATVQRPDQRIAWHVVVDAAVTGVDYHATFDVPIFQTEESPPPGSPIVDDGPRDRRFEAMELSGQHSAASLSNGITMTAHGDDSVTFAFSRARKRKNAVIWAASSILSGILAIGLLFVGGWLFTLLLLPTAAVMAFAGVYCATTNKQIDVVTGQITASSRNFFWNGNNTVPVEKIRFLRVYPRLVGSSGSSWAVRLQIKDEYPVELADGFSDRSEAEWIAREIADAAGLPEESIKVGDLKMS